MAVLKAIVSLYCAGEEKPVERYKTEVKVADGNKLLSSLKKKYYRVSWVQRAEQAQKFRLGPFDLKFYRLTKFNGKADNYAISTQQQQELELLLFSTTDCDVVKGFKVYDSTSS